MLTVEFEFACFGSSAQRKVRQLRIMRHRIAEMQPSESLEILEFEVRDQFINLCLFSHVVCRI